MSRPQKKRPRGRPAGKTLTIVKTLKLDVDTAERLQLLAETAAMNESAFLRLLIRQAKA